MTAQVSRRETLREVRRRARWGEFDPPPYTDRRFLLGLVDELAAALRAVAACADFVDECAPTARALIADLDA